MDQDTDTDTDFLYHYTPPLLISGLGGVPLLQDHPLEQTGDRLCVRPTAIDHPVAKDIYERFASKSHERKLYESQAPKAIKQRVNHLINVRFIDDTYRLMSIKEEGTYPNSQQHSALSPRNPHSALYPDGLLNEYWIQKYLYLSPAIVISFHLLGDTSGDEQLSKDLGALKSQWAKRHVKFVAVIIGENSVTDERISNLRRQTGLEKRTGLLFVPTSSSTVEKETFVETVCQMAYSQSIEFYNQLCKNIRKKKTSQHHHLMLNENESFSTTLPLTSAGWEARYSFKLAAFSEFKQDLDNALKGYETAYENIIELLQLSNLNQRWREALMLVDVVAYKMWKICLYLNQPNLGYRKFCFHIKHVLKVVEGREEFDKELWEAKQYLRLAKLVEIADGITIEKSSPYTSGDENTGPARMPRCGFLYLRAVEMLRESDGFDLEKPIFDSLTKAMNDLDQNNHHKRSVAYSLYQNGEALVATEDYKGALKSLKSAADVYRSDSWNTILIPILKLIVKCAKEEKDESYEFIKSSIELNVLNGDDIEFKEKKEDDDDDDEQVELTELSGDVGPFSCEFAFGTSQMNIGLPDKSQLILKSKRGWKLDSLELDIEGLDNIKLEHEELDGEEFFTDKADLEFKSNQTKIIQLTHIAKELGEGALNNITATTTLGGQYKYKFSIPFTYPSSATVQWYSDSRLFRHKRILSPQRVHIAPRPARIKMHLQNVGTAAAGEILSLQLDIKNNEEEPIQLELVSKTATNEGKQVEVDWEHENKTIEQQVGHASYPFKVIVPTSGATGLTVEFFASYVLASDPVRIKEAIAMSVPVVKPFRVNFDVSPRAHPDPWPSVFVPQEQLSHSPLIKKRWDLTASLLYIGELAVVVLGSSLEVVPTNAGEAECAVIKEPEDIDHKQLTHNQGSKMSFVFDISRGEKEIRSVAAEAYLKIKWKRENSQEINTFHIPVVRLNLPIHEPRVILDCETDDKSRFIRLLYYIENSTNHILTYSLSMSSSSAFAFQGSKQQALRVMPYTRRIIDYTLLPLDEAVVQDSAWVKLPQLKIHDTYFKRTLVIVPATPILKTEKGELYVQLS